ncbi:hypothetical protein EB796_014593 [Bugula neritina]|uniref:Uncharacterized protein n=1 Tax=Bugula neritina TaxID=10212 RepID=A0A7J7JM57_BUGNE|nr:hypothetical protein EB796_014593 [Bugula neritina]
MDNKNIPFDYPTTPGTTTATITAMKVETMPTIRPPLFTAVVAGIVAVSSHIMFHLIVTVFAETDLKKI